MADAVSKILTGARAKISIGANVVGLFSQCSWSIRQGKEPAYTLGRYHPAEITPTTQEAVSISLTGYRVVEAGPYKVGGATMLKDLLKEQDFSVTITDRDTNKPIFKAVGCRVVSWSSGVAARGVSDLRLEIVAVRAEDEFADALGGDSEADGSTSLEDGT